MEHVTKNLLKTLKRTFVSVFIMLVLFSITTYVFGFGNTFLFDSERVSMDVVVGGGEVSAEITVVPGEGDFEYPAQYELFLQQSTSDPCFLYDADTGYCEEYDFASWAEDGLLCNYFEFGEPDDGTKSLTIPDDENDVIHVSMNVPCHSGQCSPASPVQWPPVFPEELLGQELTCDVTVGEKIQVSLLQPERAYAAEGFETFTISAVVREEAEQEATLSLSTEGRYEGVRGVDSSGPHPEKGVANEDTFTFKVVYTNENGEMPESLEVVVGGGRLTMNVDESSVDTALHDGDVSNGEQYVATGTFTQGGYSYEFIAKIGDKEITLREIEDANLMTFISGYSSVAFFPGLQSSRLFEKNEGDWFENQLWEPNRDADAQALTMRSDGTSLNPDIYTKVGPDGVIDEILDFMGNIYKSFLSDLESWKNDDHLMADYAVLAYDWRLAFEDILQGGEVDGKKIYYDTSHTGDVPYIFSELERLAEGSDTGRVVLVGHSMGGLVIKKLLADIEDDTTHPYRDLLGKIDEVVLVASPQLGTPKAVSSLLHGTGQNFEPLAKKETLRILAYDMPSAYTLVPSPTYFETVFDVDEEGVELDHTLLITGRYSEVTDYESMRDFLSINFGSDDYDLSLPMRPRSDYLDDAKALHERLDEWVPPDIDNDGTPDFKVVQVAGWGIQDTIRGIGYEQAQRTVECESGLTGPCYEDFINPTPLWTMDGDGTVVVPSAVAMGSTSDEEKGVETWYVDMYEYNQERSSLLFTNINRNHASIFEIKELREFISNTIQRKECELSYLYEDVRNVNNTINYLRLAMHSPVDVSVIGIEGRVGVTSSEDGVVVSENRISNSYYFELGEGKYLGVPLNGEEYTIELNGTDEGVFTFELVEERNGKVYESKTFSKVPVNLETKGELHITNLSEVDVLELDTNGDGIADTIVYADEYEEVVSFEMLADEIQKLNTKSKKQLLQTTSIAKRFADKGYTRLAKHMLHILEFKVTLLSSEKRPKNMQISKSEADHIVLIIQEFMELL